MIKINPMFYIMNHYLRKPTEIVRRLAEQGANAKIHTDWTNYYKDKKSPNRYAGLNNNYLSILEDKCEAPWKVIFHDDVLIPPGLVDKINYILQFAPRSVIAFYNPTNGAYAKALEQKHHALRTYRNFWGPCHAFPTELGYAFASWAREHQTPFGLISEDHALQIYCTLTENPIYAVLPSLIQHEGFDKSIFSNPAKVGLYFRNSANYNPLFDVTEIDWVSEFAAPYPEDRKMTDFAGIDGQLRKKTK